MGGRLEPDDAAQRRRNPARAAGVGAQPGERHAVGDGYRGTRRRAAGDARGLALEGVERGAVMRIDPEPGEGELGHAAAPDRYESGRAQPRHGRRILPGRGSIAQRDRAGRGHVAGDVEQVLDRDRDAGKRRRRGAARPQAVMEVGCRQRIGRMHLEKNPAPFARWIGDPGQALLDQRAACAAAGEFGPELGERLHGVRPMTSG